MSCRVYVRMWGSLGYVSWFVWLAVIVVQKMSEIQHHHSLPHLIVPAVTEAKKVPLALGWVIREMEKRFQIFAKSGVRNITAFNTREKKSIKPEVETLDELDAEIMA